MSQEILLMTEGHTATLTLNRPQKGNALNTTMANQLVTFLNQLKEDRTIKVVVLTGSGKYFCTGLDLSMTSNTVKASFTKALEFFETLYHYPKPIIAKINGPCLGGGVGLVFTTDIRVAHKDVYFALTEVKRGLIPAIISQYIVPELGSQRAKEYMLTGKRVPVRELGSVLSAVVDSDKLDDKVNEYIGQLLDSAPVAMTNIKRLVHNISRPRSKEAQDYIKGAYLDMTQSKEAAYGIQSFINNKKPDWSKL